MKYIAFFTLVAVLLIAIKFQECHGQSIEPPYGFRFNFMLVCPYKNSFDYKINLWEMDLWSSDDYLGEIAGSSNTSRKHIVKTMRIPSDEFLSFTYMFRYSVEHNCDRNNATKKYHSVIDEICIYQGRCTYNIEVDFTLRPDPTKPPLFPRSKFFKNPYPYVPLRAFD
ncbi:unnamed protein product [Caenorhabditis bovis]|uniref:Uncharacterized protein n=1 Tax=Caenorhabditis bovis TaxID=2654633 RepID=A0A8S1FEM4_9PELO|nr:unnamed protein product [Caenorhabditis bovis]